MHTQNPKSEIRNGRSAFTLMELMVSVTILIAIILAINISFSGATKAVTSSQATMELMANVRATQSLLERDLRGLDRNSFLVIRSRLHNADNSTVDPATGQTFAQESLHFDQISFISLGQFQNPTGADTATPFTDSSTAAAAHVWWGQLIMEKNAPPDASYNVSGSGGPNQQLATPQNQLPTGALPNGAINESEFVLGHHQTLLFPGPATGGIIDPAGNNVAAYSPAAPGIPSIAISSSPVTGYDGSAHISSSRYAVAAQTPEQIMQNVITARTQGDMYPEANLLTYRFRALQSVYDTEVTTNPFVNGVYRMSPVVMAGVSSFKVEWTDGTVYSAGTIINNVNVSGQVVWFGYVNPRGDFYDPAANPTGIEMPNAALIYNDNYMATFSYFNRSKWPTALRFTYHVYGDRLGGRDIVQVVNLPQ